MTSLPTVLATSVIRSSHEGESHGGVYLIDLATNECEQVIRWSYGGISWEGRGSERGLRGIAYYDDLVLIAASDELWAYDKDFNVVDKFTNRYLKHCHEIHRAGDTLWLSSTGFDSVLGLDLKRGRFWAGYHLTKHPLDVLPRRFDLFSRYSIRPFDPEGDNGPPPRVQHAATFVHLNNVWVDAGTLLMSGTGLAHVLALHDGTIRRLARIPRGTHNARPFRGGILANHTRANRIAFMSRRGRLRRSFPVKTYDASQLTHSSLPADHARQAFARGLCTWDGRVVIGGSSPATISAFEFDTTEVLARVNITMDVRNAIHGLEVWPF
jgi:hypothetical protein